MNNYRNILIFYVCCIVFYRSNGAKLHNYVPQQESSYRYDEYRSDEKKMYNMYPESSINNGRPQFDHIYKINANKTKDVQQNLKQVRNEKYPTELDSSDYKTLEMIVGEHLVKVKSKKESPDLGSASSSGGFDASINPKYSHVIEIIHRGDNIDKPGKNSDSTAEKQPLELTKTPSLEKIKVSEDANPEENVSMNQLKPSEFGEINEGDSNKFIEEDEEDSEEYEDDVDGDPDELDESDEENLEEFGGSDDDDDDDDLEEIGEPGDGDFEEFEKGDLQKIDEVEEKFESDLNSKNPGDFEKFEDKLNIKETDDAMYPERFDESNKIGTKQNGNYEGDSIKFSPDNTEGTMKIVEVSNYNNSVTDNEHIPDKESALNEEFEGSGEFDDFNDRNSTKSGRILGMFSRDNETFPNCTTPKGETGRCRRLGECLLSEALNNFNGFLQQLCLIRGARVGICCPDNPVIETINPDTNSTSQLTPEDIEQPPEGCGLNTKTRIVGGSISVPHEWTWMVALMRRNRFYCGGVIINNWYILTAAHCVMGMNVKDLTVRLGEYDFNEQSKHTEDLSVSEIKRHAQFVTLTFQHDIALLKLKRSIKYSKFVGSICLPDQKARDYSDAKGTVVGWGTVSFGGAASPILRQVTVPVWKNEDCDRTYLLENIGDSFMCAGSPEKGEDACQGDSGGPLMTVNENGRYEVIGLVSWGRRCGDPTYPGVYTRVTTYLDWIKQNAV